MKKSKRENKARIFPIRSYASIRSKIKTSEVTRDLFVGTWKTYLDNAGNLALKLHSKSGEIKNSYFDNKQDAFEAHMNLITRDFA